MPRVGGLRTQSYMVSVGSNTETLPTTAPNLSIASTENRNSLKRTKKTPLRAASCIIPRVSSLDSTPSLPDRAPEAMSRSENSQSKSLKRSSFRAAERGRTDVLPTTSSIARAVPARERSSSSSNISRFSAFRASVSSTDQIQAMTRSLRNRRSTAHLDDELSNVPIVEDIPLRNEHTNGYGNGGRGVKYTWSDNFGKTGKPPGRRSVECNSWKIAILNMRRGQLLQALIMLTVTFFVLDSYYKAISATEQLLSVKQDESMMMLHLKRLEEQAMNLHEIITHMSETGSRPQVGNADGTDVDAVLNQTRIRAEINQLESMEDELDAEVKSLQKEIQKNDRKNIVKAFGEGSVQVTFEIAFPDGVHTSSTHISVMLYYETPHAAWTLLNQVQRGLWDGAPFSMDQNLALVAEPETFDDGKRLDFVEKSQKQHSPWTVGLTDSGNGKFSLFINLQDNTNYHKHDVCVGKIIDGFDALQRLTRTARQEGSRVSIKKATASHLKRKDSAGLI